MTTQNKPKTTTTPVNATAAGTISISAGHMGNIKKFVLEGNGWTVADVLKYAELDATGYDIRVSGKPAKLDTPVTDGQSVMLFRAVQGN